MWPFNQTILNHLWDLAVSFNSYCPIKLSIVANFFPVNIFYRGGPCNQPWGSPLQRPSAVQFLANKHTFAIDASGAKRAGLACQDKYSDSEATVDLRKVDLERPLAAALSFLHLWTWKTGCSTPLCSNVVIYANTVIIISCQLPREDVIPTVLIWISQTCNCAEGDDKFAKQYLP